MFQVLNPQDVSRLEDQTRKVLELCCCDMPLSPRLHGTGAFSQQGEAGRFAFFLDSLKNLVSL